MLFHCRKTRLITRTSKTFHKKQSHFDGIFYFYKMNIKQYLDSTYLKTANQAGISDQQDIDLVKSYIQEAIDENFKLIMIRPKHVLLAYKIISENNSKLQIGTVIDFPKGKGGLEKN